MRAIEQTYRKQRNQKDQWTPTANITRAIVRILAMLVAALPVSTLAQARSQHLRVLTFNAWVTPLVAPHIAERVNALCARLKRDANTPRGWDVVLLQETWISDHQKRLISDCGYPHAAVANETKPSGLIILSRHKITRIERMNFSKDLQEMRVSWKNLDGEALVHKGALAVQISPPWAGAVWIVNTHLISRYHDKGVTYEAGRRRQFGELVGWIKDLKLPANRLIIGGDFNVAPEGSFHEPLWNDIPKIFFDTLGTEMHQAPFDAHRDCTSCPGEGKIDHLFGAKTLRPANGRVVLTESVTLPSGETTRISDHFGWETEFEL